MVSPMKPQFASYVEGRGHLLPLELVVALNTERLFLTRIRSKRRATACTRLPLGSGALSRLRPTLP